MRTSVLVFLVSHLCLTTICSPDLWAQETKVRIAEYLKMERKVYERVSFTMAGNLLIEEPVDESRKEFGAIEYLQRYVLATGSRGNRWRVDTWRLSLGSQPEYSAQWFDGVDSFVWTSLRKRVNEQLQQVEVKAGIPASQISSRINFPLKTACVSCANMSAGIFDDNELFRGDFTVVEERELSDGRLSSTLAWREGGWEIVFSKDHEWAPEEIRFFYRGNKPIKVDKLTGDQVRKWQCLGATETRWTEDPTGKYVVPEYVRMDCEDGTAESREYIFVDWKFGEDVDERLLDRKEFTVEKLPKAFDFTAAQATVAAKRKEIQKQLK